MDEKAILERLATSEAKIGFIKELVTEIKDDVKNQPDKDEFDSLRNRLESLEKSYTSLVTKVSIIMTVGSIVLQIALKLLFNL